MATEPDTEKRDEQQGNDAFRVAPPARQRVADHVFETLARGILRGELAPGDALPTQRELARQFNISPLVVRQAIHRLEDLGLVRVRQGSSTLILDPAESSDIRVVQLQMELSDPGETFAADALENQLLFVVPLLGLAERRVTDEDLTALRALVQQAEAGGEGQDHAREFRVRYWQRVAQSTHNTLFRQQVRWWGSLVADLERRGKRFRLPSAPVDVGFYARLNQALAEGEGAVQLYLTAIRPILDRLDEQRGLGRSGGSPKG